MPLERWQRILDTNLTGIFLTCKYGLRPMLAEQISGSIVCTSSPTCLWRWLREVWGVQRYQRSYLFIGPLHGHRLREV